MDVSVETTGNLGRRLKFIVSSAEVDEQVRARLQKMKKTVRLDGFRPGKVPLKVIQERFGRRVFDEVASEVMESSYQRAVVDHGLAPAGYPDFKDTSILPGQDIKFTADIELYPEFELAPLKKVTVEKLVSEVQVGDLDDMVERLRLQHADWRTVQRAAQDGDLVRVRLEQKVEAFNTDDNGDLVLTIGASGVAGDFGRQLIKASCGDTKKIKIKFPKDYPQTALAGRKIKFRAEVREVKESVLAALDRSFFERCGVKEGGLEALKEMLKEGMEYELKNKLQSNFKKKVLNVLLEKHKIEAPQVIIRHEVERMRNDAAERFGDKENIDKLDDALFSKQAERHVKLRLIMNKIAERNEFDVSPREFEARLDDIAAAYEDADAVRRHYRNDRHARGALIGLILEDKVFQWTLDQINIEEKTCNFKDAMHSEPV